MNLRNLPLFTVRIGLAAMSSVVAAAADPVPCPTVTKAWNLTAWGYTDVDRTP